MEGNNRCFRRKQATEHDLVSIRYPSGEVRPLVDNIWYQGVECAKQVFTEVSPHECLYRQVCYGSSATPLTNCYSKFPEFFKQTVYEKKDLLLSCAKSLICERKEKPPQQSQEEQEREKANISIETNCGDTEFHLGNIPKECAFKGAIQLGRKNTLYADVYHDDKDGKFCGGFEKMTDRYPRECIFRYVEKLDKKNPPPTKDETESEASETAAEKSS